MPSQQEIYEGHAAEYEALIAHEDHEGNILAAIRDITPLPGLDVLDVGAGTGRLARLLQPHVRRVAALDLSPHMLAMARQGLLRGAPNWLVAAADHRRLPLDSAAWDLLVSGWSVSYVAVWDPEHWREQSEAWLAEARRVLSPAGTIILLESLGTGNETPQRLPHLEHFYDWLDEKGFAKRWIRTDYRFPSVQDAGRIAGFFFGDEMKQRIESERLTVLPECTGVWWLGV